MSQYVEYVIAVEGQAVAHGLIEDRTGETKLLLPVPVPGWSTVETRVLNADQARKFRKEHGGDIVDVSKALLDRDGPYRQTLRMPARAGKVREDFDTGEFDGSRQDQTQQPNDGPQGQTAGGARQGDGTADHGEPTQQPAEEIDGPQAQSGSAAAAE